MMESQAPIFNNIEADWEIEFIKCVTWQDFSRYCHKYNDERNPFLQKALEKYDDLYFQEHRRGSSCAKYLSRFPNGRNVSEASYQLLISEENKKNRAETKENIGICIILALFLVTFIGMLAGMKMSFGEAIAAQGVLCPLYYTIFKIVENKKKA